MLSHSCGDLAAVEIFPHGCEIKSSSIRESHACITSMGVPYCKFWSAFAMTPSEIASVPGLPRFDLPFAFTLPLYYCERKRKVPWNGRGLGTRLFHRCSEDCHCTVVVRWTGQLPLLFPYAINLPYQSNNHKALITTVSLPCMWPKYSCGKQLSQNHLVLASESLTIETKCLHIADVPLVVLFTLCHVAMQVCSPWTKEGGTCSTQVLCI